MTQRKTPWNPAWSLAVGLLAAAVFAPSLAGGPSLLDHRWNPHPVGMSVPVERSESSLARMSRSLDHAAAPHSDGATGFDDAEAAQAENTGARRINLALHSANSTALALVLSRATVGGWPAIAAAALFAVHPATIDVVARSGRRGELLATFLFLIALGCYVSYANSDSGGTYLLALLAYVCAVTTHPIVVLGFVAFAIVDLWPLGRLSAQEPAQEPAEGHTPPDPARLGAEKVPFVVVAGLGWAFTLIMGDPRALSLATSRTPIDAIATALAGLGRSLIGLVAALPADVLTRSASWPLAIVAGLVAIVLTTFTMRSLARSPWLAVGWLWFVALSAPELLRVAGDAGAIVAPTTYAALPGAAIALVWTLKNRMPRAAPILCIVIVCLVGARTWSALPWWDNDFAIAKRAAQSGAPIEAGLLAAEAATRNGQPARTTDELHAALELAPESSPVHAAVAINHANQQRFAPALRHARRAVELDPMGIVARRALAVALERNGEPDKALTIWRELQIETRDATATAELGAASLRDGDPSAAVDLYRSALSFDDRNAEIFFGYGKALNAIRLDPQQANNEEAKRSRELAQQAFERTLALSPGHDGAARELGLLAELAAQSDAPQSDDR
ncbi:MAG: Flp pilus assembly protein TadD [Candidatus Binatia bacterium]